MSADWIAFSSTPFGIRPERSEKGVRVIFSAQRYRQATDRQVPRAEFTLTLLSFLLANAPCGRAA